MATYPTQHVIKEDCRLECMKDSCSPTPSVLAIGAKTKKVLQGVPRTRRIGVEGGRCGVGKIELDGQRQMLLEQRPQNAPNPLHVPSACYTALRRHWPSPRHQSVVRTFVSFPMYSPVGKVQRIPVFILILFMVLFKGASWSWPLAPMASWPLERVGLHGFCDYVAHCSTKTIAATTHVRWQCYARATAGIGRPSPSRRSPHLR